MSGRTDGERTAYAEGYLDGLQNALRQAREKEELAYADGLVDGTEIGDRALRRARRLMRRPLVRPGGRR